MDRFGTEQLGELLSTPHTTAISIYMPSHVSGPEKQQDTLRLRNLLDEAQRRLEFNGMGTGAAEELLGPARGLLSDEDFWLHQEDGLAVFIAPDFLRSYRLPLNFNESLSIAGRFRLRELAPMLGRNGLFFVLAASEQQIRLLRCSRDSVSSAGLSGAPASLEANERFSQREHYLGFYSRGSGGGTFFYGQSGAAEREELAQEDFALRVARALDEELYGEHAPLVIAATQELAHMLRHQIRYPQVLEEIVSGNPDQLNPAQLQQKALPLVAERLDTPRRQALDQLGQQLGTGKGAQHPLAVAQAALEGRIDSLFINPEASYSGAIDAETGSPRAEASGISGPAEDLLELAVHQTLATGGVVYLSRDGELDPGTPAAAVLRY